MDENDHTNETLHAPPGAYDYQSNRVEFDLEKYRHYLEDEDLSEKQKLELLHALWMIMTSFVDLGFSIHPVQQACGQIEEPDLLPDSRDDDALYSQMKSCIRNFRGAAQLSEHRDEEGVSL